MYSGHGLHIEDWVRYALKEFKGTSVNFKSPYIGRITDKVIFFPRVGKGDILLTTKIPKLSLSKGLYILPDSAKADSDRNKSIIYLCRQAFDELKEGDIIKATPDGSIQVLWEESSSDNVIFTTDFCNSACIMCPQIPRGEPFSYFEQNLRMLSLVKDSRKLHSIGITGGEPTIFKDEILKILTECYSKFPSVPIEMLTNGKNFDDFKFAKSCVLAHPRTTFCIPLYASYSEKHDYIVGADGSFEKTIKGIYNLTRLRQNIEIRIVILKHNYQDLPVLIDYIYHNMPFVSHVAIMGMEITGMAKSNCEEVWVDPTAYQDELKKSVLMLKRYNLPFSIYNLPRCLLEKKLWGYDRDSISKWKKVYLEKCGNCKEKERCCGVFATSSKQSSNIKPISYSQR